MGVATNNGLGEQAQIRTFLYRKFKCGLKSPMFLHRVNNIEHNIKQNSYTYI